MDDTERLQHRDFRFLTPRDLRQTHDVIKKVMVIGSCAIGELPMVGGRSSEGTEIAFFNVNHGCFLPNDIPGDPDDFSFQVLQFPLRFILPDEQFMRLGLYSLEQCEQLFAQACSTLAFAFGNAIAWTKKYGIPAFILGFPVPQLGPMGRFMPRYELTNAQFFIEKMNEYLHALITDASNVYFVDYDAICASFGKKFIFDDYLTHFSHGATLNDNGAEFDQNRLEPSGRPSETYGFDPHLILGAVWEETASMFRTLRGIDSIKAVIVDLDDIMWRGIAAEADQVDGSMVEGWPIGFAEALLYLKARGVMLGIVSRNDESRVRELWGRIYGSKINLDDFVSIKIGWGFKGDGVTQILSELNILAKNTLFIDDNPVERAAVSAAVPGIRVIGSNPYVLRRVLLWSPETQVAVITDESRRRTDMVKAQIQREIGRSTLSREEFLASLNVEVTVIRLDMSEKARCDRAFELLNKTNQFNTNGVRWLWHDFDALVLAGGVHCFEVTDAHTSYGLVGVILTENSRIIQFVMSCRVLGLDAELAAIHSVVQHMRRPVKASMTQTEANLPARDLWDRAGFVQQDGEYLCEDVSLIKAPSHIRLVELVAE